MTKTFLTATITATALMLAASVPALAQTQAQQQHHDQSDSGGTTLPQGSAGMMQRMSEGTSSGDTQKPMMGGEGADMDMMDCAMMAEMMRMHRGMMAQMMRMHPEMMAMMHKAMGPGGEASMDGGGGSGNTMRQGEIRLDSGIVRPIEHLSLDDVRHFFEHRLQQLGNDRLKVGAVTQTDENKIAVEIVTVEDSLVDRLAVDRHGGAIQRVQ